MIRCAFCDKKFKGEREVIQHERSVHAKKIEEILDSADKNIIKPILPHGAFWRLVVGRRHTKESK